MRPARPGRDQVFGQRGTARQKFLPVTRLATGCASVRIHVVVKAAPRPSVAPQSGKPVLPFGQPVTKWKASTLRPLAAQAHPFFAIFAPHSAGSSRRLFPPRSQGNSAFTLSAHKDLRKFRPASCDGDHFQNRNSATPQPGPEGRTPRYGARDHPKRFCSGSGTNSARLRRLVPRAAATEPISAESLSGRLHIRPSAGDPAYPLDASAQVPRPNLYERAPASPLPRVTAQTPALSVETAPERRRTAPGAGPETGAARVSRLSEKVVPEAGLEPARPLRQRILNPSCLPFHHSGPSECRAVLPPPRRPVQRETRRT